MAALGRGRARGRGARGDRPDDHPCRAAVPRRRHHRRPERAGRPPRPGAARRLSPRSRSAWCSTTRPARASPRRDRVDARVIGGTAGPSTSRWRAAISPPSWWRSSWSGSGSARWRIPIRALVALGIAGTLLFGSAQILRAYDQAAGRELAFAVERTVNRVVLIQPRTLEALQDVDPARTALLRRADLGAAPRPAPRARRHPEPRLLDLSAALPRSGSARVPRARHRGRGMGELRAGGGRASSRCWASRSSASGHSSPGAAERRRRRRRRAAVVFVARTHALGDQRPRGPRSRSSWRGGCSRRATWPGSGGTSGRRSRGEPDRPAPAGHRGPDGGRRSRWSRSSRSSWFGSRCSDGRRSRPTTPATCSSACRSSTAWTRDADAARPSSSAHLCTASSWRSGARRSGATRSRAPRSSRSSWRWPA